jgi:hypothetical protein
VATTAKRWQIVRLFSPVCMPRTSGACEAGIGAAKRLSAPKSCKVVFRVDRKRQ